MTPEPLAPLPGAGVEMARLEAAPPPEPEEAQALATVWGHLPPEARRGRRDLLLPALHALQAARGWISYPALAAVCRELGVALAEAYGVASFYSLFRTQPGPRWVLHVCDDVSCMLRGAGRLLERLRDRLGPPAHAAAGEVGRDGRHAALGWAPSPCLGQCDRGPAVLAGDRVWLQVTEPALEAWLREAACAETGELAARLASGPSVPRPTAVGSLGPGTPLLVRRCGHGGCVELADYLGSGGYRGLRRALEIGPRATLAEVEASRLVGRGGAAFPAARKWAAVAGQGAPRYVVCNADESEPGTFKDRLLLEEDPFAVIEGMTVAAFASGAEKGYVYVRGEYPDAVRAVEGAIEQARSHGYLGRRILGSEFDFDIEVRKGAGAYICGEETALFNSIEGLRGEPRARPPFPTQAGLFGRPTVINNVETLACVPPILERGGEWYASLGTERSRGTKLVSVSGHVLRPGVYEVTFGTPLRRVVEELAGGVPGGRRVSAVLCGGAAGTFLPPEALDRPLAFEALAAIGGTVGSGALVVFDETVDLWEIGERIARFFRDESCGQCVPCRVGTRRQWEWVREARRRGGDVDGSMQAMLEELTRVMRDASICGLGQLAPNAIASLIRLRPGAAATGAPAS